MKLAIHYELDKALAIAARNGDPTIVDKLLETGLHPDSGRDPDSGLSSFTAASQQWGSSGSSGHFQVLISLLQHGADPGQVDQNGRSLLMWAALRGNALLLRLILFEAGQAGLHHTKVLDAQDGRGRTALMEAVAAQDDGCVALLLAAGADADFLGQPGVVARDEEAAPPAAGAETAPARAPAAPQTALAMLSSSCTAHAPAFLVPLACHTTALRTRNDHGDTFLVWACRWGHTEAVRAVLDRFSAEELGANEPPAAGAHSAVELAFMCRRHEICQMLVDEWQLGVAVPDTTREGAYIGIDVLRIAIAAGWGDVALQIIETFTPFDPHHDVVTQALHDCITRRWHNCLEALLARGVPPTVKTVQSVMGDHPAVTAARHNDLGALRALIAAGAGNLELPCVVSIWLGHAECFHAIWAALVPRSSDLIRAAACVAALVDAVDVLAIVNAEAARCAVRIHAPGRNVEACVLGWCSVRALHRAVPSLFRVLRTENPCVPLLCAVSKGHFAATSLLLEQGADPRIADEQGLSPLLWACTVGHLEIVKLLIKAGADLAPRAPSLAFATIVHAYQQRRLHNGRSYVTRALKRSEAAAHPQQEQELQQRQAVAPRAAPELDIQLHVAPLLCALLAGHALVVALLVEAGAPTAELTAWCDRAVAAEPRFAPLARQMLSTALRYEDFRAFGPFGVAQDAAPGGAHAHAHVLSASDLAALPSDLRPWELAAVVAHFAPADWSLAALQLLYRHGGGAVEGAVHRTLQPHAGHFQGTDHFAHLERLDLRRHEYIMQVPPPIPPRPAPRPVPRPARANLRGARVEQAEVAIEDGGAEGKGGGRVASLRFTTNQRVCKWLGPPQELGEGATAGVSSVRDPARPEPRVVTMHCMGREIVGLFTTADAKRFLSVGCPRRPLRRGAVQRARRRQC